MAIKVRRGNKADLVIANLLAGEPALALDTKEFGIKLADGTMFWVPSLDANGKVQQDALNALKLGGREATEYFIPIKSISRKIANASEPINVKLIGDSIVAGYGGTGYATDGEIIYDTNRVNTSGTCFANSLITYLSSHFNCSGKNYGIVATNSTDIVNHLSDLVKSTDDIIICMIGTNNRLLSDGINVLRQDLLTIYNYVKNLGKEIIFMSSIPATAADEASRYHTMLEVDNVIMGATSELGIEYISLYKLFIQYLEDKGYDLTDLLSDTVHPNDKGYGIIEYLVLSAFGFGLAKSGDGLNNNISTGLTLENGFTRIGTDPHGIAKSGHIVLLQLAITNTSAATIGMTICRLDSRFYRAAANCIGYIYDDSGNKYKIIVFNDGRVDLYTALSANTFVWGNLSWIV